jgi:hypothetical protein
MPLHLRRHHLQQNAVWVPRTIAVGRGVLGAARGGDDLLVDCPKARMTHIIQIRESKPGTLGNMNRTQISGSVRRRPAHRQRSVTDMPHRADERGGTGRVNEHSPGPDEPKRVDSVGVRWGALSAACADVPTGTSHCAIMADRQWSQRSICNRNLSWCHPACQDDFIRRAKVRYALRVCITPGD